MHELRLSECGAELCFDSVYGVPLSLAGARENDRNDRLETRSREDFGKSPRATLLAATVRAQRPRSYGTGVYLVNLK